MSRQPVQMRASVPPDPVHRPRGTPL